jgi:hypothetical protein
MKQEIYQRQVIKKLSQLNQAQQQIKSKRNYIIINSSILTASTDEAVTGYNVYNEVLVTDNPITAN